MPTTKQMGCGGQWSYLNFFPCELCLSKNNTSACENILTSNRTTKHKEYCSDMVGKMWGKKHVYYYVYNQMKKQLVEIDFPNSVK